MKLKHYIVGLTVLLSFFSKVALAADHATIALAVGGYDLVSYHQSQAVTGNGHHLAEHQGNTYAFANASNKEAFISNPEKYLPQFGGYCAYGAALGKKFYGDPSVYEIVDGKLYLNLDAKVQSLWSKDRLNNIAEANKLWPSIKYVPSAEL
jgi:YHS domain-containing protein